MWAGGENQGNFLGRISIRRNQVASMEGDVEDLEHFQKKVSEQFSDLLNTTISSSSSSVSSKGGDDNNHSSKHHHDPPSSVVEGGDDRDRNSSMHEPSPGRTLGGEEFSPLLSIAWLRKLLDAFLCCEAEFKAVLLMGRDPSQVAKAPLDKLIPDMLDRAVKALDVCNAVSHGIDAVKFVHSQAQIVVSALQHRPYTDGQIRRARRGLAAVLASVAMDEKESGGKWTERNRSFGRRSSGASSGKDLHPAPNFKSLSWSVAKNWSAAKQIQAISSNLYAPRGGESTGLALVVYIMGVILVFAMWGLVAAIPCQDRTGLGTHIPVPKQPAWAHSLSSLQDKIAEEWKKKEKKGCAGLMDEVVKVEKLASSLADFADNFQYPMDEEKEADVAVQVAELEEICRRMEEGLGPLQQQIREVFHRLVKSRTVVLDVLDQAGKSATPHV